MRKLLGRWWPLFLLLGISAIFFHKTLTRALVPFPGDLLVSEYKPWQTYSFLGYTPGSIPNKAQYFDTVRQLYPWQELATDMLKTGAIPLWNPHNFSGSPLLANSQSAVLYPLHIVYLLLPQLWAWSLLVMIQPLLAAAGTYWYLRRLRLPKMSSLFGGIAFGFSLFMTVFLEYNSMGHVIMWLPFCLGAIEALRDRPTHRMRLAYAGSLLAAGLAGHLQLFTGTLVVVVTYGLLRLNRQGGHTKISHLILTALTLGMCGIQMLPTVELIRQSARVDQPYRTMVENLLIQPKQIFMWFSPDIFGNPATRNYTDPGSYPGKALYTGLASLFFLHLALRQKSRPFASKFFTWVMGAVLLLVIRTPVTEWLYRFSLPLISTSSPANMLFLLSLATAVLGAYGHDAWMKHPEKRPWYSLLLYAVIFGLIAALSATGTVPVVRSMLIFSGLVFGALAAVILTAPWLTRFGKPARLVSLTGLLLVLILAGDLWYFFNKFNPFVPAGLVYPATPVTDWLKQNAGYDRFWGYGSAGIEANFATSFRLFSAEGYDPLYPKRYGELIAASRDGKLLRSFDTATRSDARIAPGFGRTDMAENRYRLKILALTATRYILDRTENGTDQTSFPPETFRQVYDRDGWRIYEYTRSLPRVFLTGKLEYYGSPAEFEQKLFHPDFDPRTTALVEERSSEPLAASDSADTAAITSYLPNTVTIQTRTEGRQFLVLSDTYYPGWVADIDGQPAPIVRTNYAFRGLYVPGGTHTVRFRYAPSSFSLGIKLSMISVLGLILYLYREGKRIHA